MPIGKAIITTTQGFGAAAAKNNLSPPFHVRRVRTPIVAEGGLMQATVPVSMPDIRHLRLAALLYTARIFVPHGRKERARRATEQVHALRVYGRRQEGRFGVIGPTFVGRIGRGAAVPRKQARRRAKGAEVALLANFLSTTWPVRLAAPRLSMDSKGGLKRIGDIFLSPNCPPNGMAANGRRAGSEGCPA